MKKKDIDISKEKLLIYDFKIILVKKRNKIYISKETILIYPQRFSKIEPSLGKGAEKKIF